MEDVGRMSGDCEEAIWKVCESCLQYVGRLSGGYWRLYDQCGEAVWSVW